MDTPTSSKNETTDQDAVARRYQLFKQGAIVLQLTMELAACAVIFFSGFTFTLQEWALRFSDARVMVIAVYVSMLGGILYACLWPVRFFQGYVWEHQFRLSRQCWLSWVWDDLKRSLIGLAVALCVVEALYFFIARFPATWWIYGAIFWMIFSLVLAEIMPKMIVPLFYTFRPLEEGALKDRIAALFEQCRFPVKEVYTIDLSVKTKKANAFLCGVGRNRRVVLSDTLLEGFTPGEIEVVLAHELGHARNRDILRMMAVNTVIIFFGLFLVHLIFGFILKSYGSVALEEIGTLPLLAVMLGIFGMISTPLSNAYSRHLEREADRFSLLTTRRRDDFIAMMEKLGRLNLAERNPGRFAEIFFYDHPPLQQRVDFARSLLGQGAA